MARRYDSGGSSGKGWLWVAIIAVPLIALSSCDDDDDVDCYRRYDPQTQQYERHCEGGLRYRSSRGYGGWGGK